MAGTIQNIADNWLPIGKAAERWGVSYTRAFFIARGLPGCQKIGRTWIVPVIEVQKWLDAHPNNQGSRQRI